MTSLPVIQRFIWWLPVAVIGLSVLLAGYCQNKLDLYLKAQLINNIQVKATLQELDYQALYSRVEAYRKAFLDRNYEAMYHLSYFKDVPKPSLIEFRNLRDPQHTYRMEVRIVEVELAGNKGKAHLELILEHPVIGVNKSTHVQEWEKINDIWYRVDYGY